MSQSLPVSSPYLRLGGEARVRELVERFYDLMDSLPEVRPLRDLHPADLSRARQVLFEFLSGWLGGPQLFVEKHGHPRLRERHLPFPIGVQERNQWLLCMFQAMQDIDVPEDLDKELRQAFFRTADFMRNQPE